MPITDWSMTILGYPQHLYSGSEVIAVSHVSTHDALAIADAVGLSSGWIFCDEMAAQLEGLPADRPTWHVLTSLFEGEHVIKTEGMVGGMLTFVADDEAAAPDAAWTTRNAHEWAEGRARPWVESIDNEMALFGGLNDEQQRRLMLWFLCRRPLNGQWRELSMDDAVWNSIRHGLFDAGWTRNCNLVEEGRRIRQEIWNGVHEQSALGKSALGHSSCEKGTLEFRDSSRLSVQNNGLKLRLRSHVWHLESREDSCPLDDVYGRMFPPVRK